MDEPTLHRLEVIGVWFTGIATFLAVILALFLQRYTERRRRPRLHIEHDSTKKGDMRYLPPRLAATTPGPEREEMWIRLRVKNTSYTPARDVELRFISSLQEGGTVRENRPSWWFKVSNFNGACVAIPPQFTQYFDLAYVKNEVGSAEDVSFHLASVRGNLSDWPVEKARIESKEENRLLVGFKYDLFFAVVSSDADAKFYRMEVKLLPRRDEDPPAKALLGEQRLHQRVEVLSLSEISSEEAFL